MTNFLIKVFIKDFEDVHNIKTRERYGVLSGFVGIFCNVILCATKIVVGILSSSVAILADGVNNLADALSSVVSIISFKISSKDPDYEHPFGHGRVEYISGFIVAFLILFVGIELIQSSFLKIINPSDIHVSIELIFVLVFSVIIKLWMGFFNRNLGQKINSTVLKAVMADSINDAISTSVVIISVIIFYFTNISLDGYIGIFVALFIIYSGIKIATETLSPLLGQSADPFIVEEIKNILSEYEEILGTHDLIVHNYGVGKNIASVHVEVSQNCDFVEVHEIIDAAEKKVFKEIGAYLVIHMDPINTEDEHVNKVKEQLSDVLFEIDNELSMHDFRLVEGNRNINLIFDVVVGFEYDKNAKKQLISTIKEKMRLVDSRYSCVITLDHKM